MATAEQYASWIVQNQDKKGTPEFETVAQAYKLSRDPNAKYKAMQKVQRVDPTEDMNILETGAAGLGKMMVDTGRGVKQLLNLDRDPQALQRRIDEEKQLTEPLMDTWGGNIGNIAGQIGLALLPGGIAKRAGMALKAPGIVAAGNAMMAPPMTMGGLGVGAGMGAAQGLIQPVATGENRAGNALVGGLAGATVPAAGMALGAAKSAVEPLYAGGRERIIGRALNEAAGPNAPQAIANLQRGGVLVPGSQPTAAEVAQSGGIAAMQRAASAVDPEAYAARGVAQNQARVDALQAMTGGTGARSAAETARESIAGPLYRQAIEQGIDPEMAQVLQPQIKNLMSRMPSGVRDRARELARVNGDTMGKEGSVLGLHYMKMAVDDLLSGGERSGIGAQTQRGLTQFKSDLLTVIDELSPAYGQARQQYAALSKPINQMDVAQRIADKSINPLTGIMQPQAFARNLNDATASAATGFDRATLANTMTPGQMGTLGNLREDLARSVAAQNLGRGAGSDTVQKLSMTNLMQQSGLPVGILNLPGIGRAGNWAYAQTDQLMKQRLAEALLDPQQTAQLMQAARTNPQLRAAIEEIRRIAAPGILGSAMTLNSQ